MTRSKLIARATALEAKAAELRTKAEALRQAELEATPLLDRMVFAAYDRCHCGAGMAYDPAGKGDDVFKIPSKWECSDIVRFSTLDAERQAAVKAAGHTAALPFAFYEIKSENQTSANGATTRPEA